MKTHRKLRISRRLFNPVYLPYLHETARTQIFFGGAGSGKSAFLAMRAVLDLLGGRNYLVVRQVAHTLRMSCLNELVKAMERLSVRPLFSVNRTEGTITARNNGCQIILCGLDDVEKIKSVTPQRGALTDLWVEEATECRQNDLLALEKRLRGVSEHPKRLTLSFNPVLKSHWIYRRYFADWRDDDASLHAEGLTILKTTYRDNLFLTPDDRQALESERDPYFYRVYTLGEWGVLGDRVFPVYRREDLRRERACCDRLLHGLDFGFSHDPCGYVQAAYDKKRGRVLVFAELSERGLTNRALAGRLSPLVGHDLLRCDSAEPKSIAELREYGLRAMGARKGPDSVIHGIQWLQGRDLVIDTSCRQLAAELDAYCWQRDRYGDALPVPVDRDNHLLDALRYALEADMLPQQARGIDISCLPIRRAAERV